MTGLCQVGRHLRRVGVQNTKRAERLSFLRLDHYPGVFVQGIGEYTEGSATKTVADCSCGAASPCHNPGSLASCVRPSNSRRTSWWTTS